LQPSARRLDDRSGNRRDLLEGLADVSHHGMKPLFGARNTRRSAPRAHLPRRRLDGNELAMREPRERRLQRMLISFGEQRDLERFESQRRHVDGGRGAAKEMAHDERRNDSACEQPHIQREELRSAKVEELHASPERRGDFCRARNDVDHAAELVGRHCPFVVLVNAFDGCESRGVETEGRAGALKDRQCRLEFV